MADNPLLHLYNEIHDTYDNIRFVRKPAEMIVANSGIQLGDRVLDVACGTGRAAMHAAEVVGQSGEVIGIDIADKLLSIAEEKAKKLVLSKVKFQREDALQLSFKDSYFDVVICASALFHFQNINKALLEWKRVLKPNGTISFSSFGSEFFTAPSLFHELVNKYVQKKHTILKPWLDNVEKCEEVLVQAGFNDVYTESKELGYYFPNFEAYWNEISSSLDGIRLKELAQPVRKKIRSELFELTKAKFHDLGMWRPCLTIFASAKNSS